MKYIKPIIYKDKYFQNIEKEIIEFYNETLFDFINQLYITYFENNTSTIFNSKTSNIEKSLKDFNIQYINNKFIGNFNIKVRKELKDLGAIFDKKTKAYTIPQYKLIGSNINNIITQQNLKLVDFYSDLNNFLNHYQDNIKNFNHNQLNFNDNISKTLTDLDQQLINTTKNYIIPAELTNNIKNEIANKYTNNLNLYIKNFSIDNTRNLRDELTNLVLGEGLRAKYIIKILQKNYKITKNKAKFLAYQETSLLISQYRQQRYTEIGLNEYEWSTSKDRRVREEHKKLDGKIFNWDNPPVIDGRAVNPGEDFGCRCVAKPVIR